jgi:GT2 family glycosyltransferase
MTDLSVVIATYNRRDTLRVTLDRLAEQTVEASRFEVIVVDDGSPDDTASMVASLQGATPFALRYYRHANRGPGYTQNRGIREARGRLVLLMADDIHGTPGMLASHLRFHDEHKEPAVASLGRVLQSPLLPRTCFQRNWDPFRFRQLDGQIELPYWKFWACNIMLKRDFLLENGLFAELVGAAHEDVELGYRLSRRGLRISYVPEALSYHHHMETLRGAAARAYERGRNWRFIEESVPDPEIHVKYHILNRHTLKHHVRTYRDLSRTNLPREDRILPWLLLRQAVRWVVFNRATVPHFWMPLLERAESSRVLGALVHPYMYRGAVFYHFVKGCSEVAGAGAGRSVSPAASA